MTFGVFRKAAMGCVLAALLGPAGASAPAAQPAKKIGPEEIDRQIAAIQKERNLPVFWKYTEDMVPANVRGMMRVSQASPEQAEVILRLTRRLLEVWPPEVTRHLKGVFIFNEIEMYGVKGVCMENDGRVFMTSNFAEYILWPRIIHESSHAVSRFVPLDGSTWDQSMAPGVRYIGPEATQGNPFEENEAIYSKGFIVKYAMIDRDEEFAVLSQYIFSEPDKVVGLMKKYPELRRRATLAINYFKALSPKIDLSMYDDVIWTEENNHRRRPGPRPAAAAPRPR
jgi:hypothetical protein